MPIDFFDDNCQEKYIAGAEFGICDNQDGQKAFVDVENSAIWIATVENTEHRAITFTAIDNCIDIIRDNGEMASRCDGMLTTENQIIFLELKDQRARWIQDAVEQLEATIRRFKDNHDISVYRHKRAFACNRRHPHFQVLDNTRKQQFYNELRVRLNVQARIKII